MSDAVAERLQAIREGGASTLDTAVAVYRSKKGNAHTIVTRVLSAVPYRDLASLVSHAKETGKRFEKSPAPKCSQSGGPTELERVDVHSYHAKRERDLVVRVLPPSGFLSSWKSSSHWWTPEGGYEDATFDEKDLETFALSVLARRIAVATNDAGERDAIAKDAARLGRSLPGEPMLLDLVGPLVRIGRGTTGLQLASMHVEAHPSDAAGHVWLGRASLEMGKTEDARRHYESAIAVDASQVDARLGIGHCLKAEGRTEEAADYFRELASEDPPVIAARYHMALLKLEADDAEGALVQFRLGETSHPDAVEYPIGCAQAFLAMDRIDEAREALVRAERIDTAHPLVVEVRRQIKELLSG